MNNRFKLSTVYRTSPSGNKQVKFIGNTYPLVDEFRALKNIGAAQFIGGAWYVNATKAPEAPGNLLAIFRKNVQEAKPEANQIRKCAELHKLGFLDTNGMELADWVELQTAMGVSAALDDAIAMQRLDASGEPGEAYSAADELVEGHAPTELPGDNRNRAREYQNAEQAAK